MAKGKNFQERAHHIDNLIRIAQTGYQLYREDFDALWQMYKGIMPENLYEQLSQRRKSALYVNKTYSLVNRLRAGTEKAYFSGNKIASFFATGQNVEEASEALQKAFDFYWNKRMNSYFTMSKTFLEGYVYGTPVCKVYWGDNRPIIDPVSVHDVYFDPSALSFQDNKFIINNIYMTTDDVAEYKKSGIYNAKFAINDIKPNNYDREDKRFAQHNQDEDSYGRVMLRDVYEKIGGKWYISTAYNSNTLLRWRTELKDGLPIVAGATVPEITSFMKKEVPTYSASILAPIVDLQMELNIRVNQEIDAIAENVNPSYEAERTSGLNEIDIRKGPSKVISCNKLEAIRRVVPPNLAPLQANEERIRQDIESIAGISEFSADNSAMINRQTAVGMDILSSEKDVRMDNYIRAVNETFVEPLVDRIGKLIWKYSPQHLFFKGIDRSTEYDFSVSVSAGLGSSSQQVQLNGYNDLYVKFKELGDEERARQTVYDSMPIMGIKNSGEYYEETTKAQKDKERAEAEAQAMELQQKQMAIEEEKVRAEIDKDKSATQLNILQAKKELILVEQEKDKAEADYSVEMEKVAVDNRKLDIEESNMLLEMTKGITGEQPRTDTE